VPGCTQTGGQRGFFVQRAACFWSGYEYRWSLHPGLFRCGLSAAGCELSKSAKLSPSVAGPMAGVQSVSPRRLRPGRIRKSRCGISPSEFSSRTRHEWRASDQLHLAKSPATPPSPVIVLQRTGISRQPGRHVVMLPMFWQRAGVLVAC